jgi:hypothetical protein
VLVRALTASAAVLALTAAPTAAARVGPASNLPPLRPSHNGHRYTPVTGDWEGTVDGLPVSFQLTKQPTFPERYGSTQYGFSNFVVAEPQSCSAPTEGPFSFATVEVGRYGQVGDNGSFNINQISGGLTAPRTARLAGSFRVGDASGQTCTLSRSWTASPAHRNPVHDGSWTVRYGDGETGTFRVTAGGRLVSRLTPPNAALGVCGIEPSGGLSAFIDTGGSALDQLPDVLTLSLQFSDRSATGTLTLPGCTTATVPVTASLSKPAA